MKKHLLLLLALLTFSICGAQTTMQTTSLPTQQFGFDGAGFLARFFNFSGSGSQSLSTYYLTYRKFKDGKNARYGIGGSLAVEGNGNDGVNTANSINFRAGSERYHDFGKTMATTTRWRAFYGWDFKTSVAFSSIGGSDNSSTLVAAGVAPVFGLQFRINDRLSLSTELAYNLFLQVQDSNGNTRLRGFTNFDAPTAIYVGYEF